MILLHPHELRFAAREVCRPFGLNAGTLRSWHRQFGLRLDADLMRDTAHRRYSMADAVRVGIIAHLWDEPFRIQPEASICFVNSIQARDAAAEAISAPADSLKRPFFVLSFDGSRAMAFRRDADEVAFDFFDCADCARPSHCLLIPAGQIIAQALSLPGTSDGSARSAA